MTGEVAADVRVPFPGEGRPMAVRLARNLARFGSRKPLGAAGGVLALTFLIMAILAPLITPYPPTRSIAIPLEAPSGDHWLGTDSLGRDVFSRTIQGSQVSLVIVAFTLFISFSSSTILGLLSGFYQGWPDYLIQRSGEAFQVFPSLILYFIIISAFGRPSTEGGTIWQVAWDLRVFIIALSIGAVFGGSRIIRGITLSLKQSDYVMAARALGADDRRLVMAHLLPNLMPIILVTISSAVGGIIIGEASLNFLGLGVSSGTPSWGSDLSGRNREFFLDAPWAVLAPGFAVSLTVLGFNLFGDALRDVLDPRLRGTGRQ